RTQSVGVDRRRDSSNGWIADSKGVRWVSDTHLTPKHSSCRKDGVEQQTECRVRLTAMLNRKSKQHHMTCTHCRLHDRAAAGDDVSAREQPVGQHIPRSVARRGVNTSRRTGIPAMPSRGTVSGNAFEYRAEGKKGRRVRLHPVRKRL